MIDVWADSFTSPTITVSEHADCWEASVHLQVGPRSFRYFAFTGTFNEVLDFLFDWKEHWRATARKLWGYEGLEHTNDDEAGESLLAKLNLVKPREPIRRRA